MCERVNRHTLTWMSGGKMRAEREELVVFIPMYSLFLLFLSGAFCQCQLPPVIL